MAVDRELLLDRVGELAERVRAVLEGPAVEDAGESSELAQALAAAGAEIRAVLCARPAPDARTAGELCLGLVELRRLRGELREHAVSVRFAAVARIHRGLAKLRACETVAELLPAAAAELGSCCDFDRAVISRRRGSTWRAEAVWLAPGLDPSVSRATEVYLRGTWIPLGPGVLETELIRRRTAEVIAADDPRTNKELMAVSDSVGYVASPVMPAGRVIGFLQADCYGSRRELTTLDRDNLWTFAQGFGLLFERTVLLERLAQQRAQAREAFELAERQLRQLAEDEILLARSDRELGAVASRAADIFRPVAAADDPVASLLTARERRIVELMVTGARNSEIADRLVLSEDTVKSHVRSVLRKLRSANRAEAVSRYLKIAMSQS
ncbi:helix-turn-helix transcriptional regulator [Protofrankia coriariae]|uniref:helix-turn-helix transcriptional regulator n=1 Tax=Protofrankia coriariae TaxID=1562887 RepID=UPI00069BA743|nr:LuxR C-terminal-related transcriptional regulator [Protofrankia coriariae]